MATKKRSRKKAVKVPDREWLKAQFADVRHLYERLGVNLEQALRAFLEEDSIPCLNISYRVKGGDSAYDKAVKKKYADPLNNIEDWCGVRIVCYYPGDISRICARLQKEFDVHATEDTSRRLAPEEFGYRSTHLVVSVKSGWLQAPNYRGLEGLKAEVQVRTILMHAWAEIEHKLAYKSVEQVPDQFRRKLSRLSAKFEEADEQFDELRLQLAEYQKRLRDDSQKDLSTLRKSPLNLDTLQALLDISFGDRPRSLQATSGVLDDINEVGLSMAEVVDAVERALPAMPELEAYEIKDLGRNGDRLWVQAGAVRTALYIANDEFYQAKLDQLGQIPEWRRHTEFGRELLTKKHPGADA